MKLIKLVKSLFPHVFPLYGMGGGGGGSSGNQSSSSSSRTEPWAPAQPYMNQGLKDAAKLYSQGPAQYTPWSQVAGFSPLQQNAMNGIQNYVSSPGVQGFMNQAGNANQGLMSGQNQVSNVAQSGQNHLAGYIGNNNQMDTGNAINQMAYGDNQNPYLKTQVGGALQQLSNNFLTNTLPGLRRNAIGDGSYGSSRNEMQEGQALSGLDNQMQQTSGQMYQNAYNTQESNRLNALGQASGYLNNQANSAGNMLNQGANQWMNNVQSGLGNYANTIGMPLNMIQQLQQVGQQQYGQDQNQLNDATNRWNFNQNAAWDNLAKYKQLIDPTASLAGSRSGTTNMTNVPAGSNMAGNIMGGLMQAGSMYGQMKSGGMFGAQNATQGAGGLFNWLGSDQFGANGNGRIISPVPQ